MSILATLIQQAATDASLRSGQYQLLRIGTNIVFANHTDALIARVHTKDMPIANLNLHTSHINYMAANG